MITYMDQGSFFMTHDCSPPKTYYGPHIVGSVASGTGEERPSRSLAASEVRGRARLLHHTGEALMMGTEFRVIFY